MSNNNSISSYRKSVQAIPGKGSIRPFSHRNTISVSSGGGGGGGGGSCTPTKWNKHNSTPGVTGKKASNSIKNSGLKANNNSSSLYSCKIETTDKKDKIYANNY